MRERLLRLSVCLHSQLPPRKVCVDDEPLRFTWLVRATAAIAKGAWHPHLSSLSVALKDS